MKRNPNLVNVHLPDGTTAWVGESFAESHELRLVERRKDVTTKSTSRKRATANKK